MRAPNQYLGATIKIYTDDNGYESWAMSSDDYVKAAVAEVIEDLDRRGLKLKGNGQLLFSCCCSCCCSCICYCCRWCAIIIFFFVVIRRSSFVVRRHLLATVIPVAITVYCCFVLFRVVSRCCCCSCPGCCIHIVWLVFCDVQPSVHYAVIVF